MEFDNKTTFKLCPKIYSIHILLIWMIIINTSGLKRCLWKIMKNFLHGFSFEHSSSLYGFNSRLKKVWCLRRICIETDPMRGISSDLQMEKKISTIPVRNQIYFWREMIMCEWKFPWHLFQFHLFHK